MSDRTQLLWTPSPERIGRANLTDFLRWLEREHGQSFDGYRALWEWSVTDLEGFWASIWDYFCLPARGPGPILESHAMPGATWFPGETVNYAEVLLARCTSTTAVTAVSQTRAGETISAAVLRDLVARAAAGLRRLGVRRGDRVVGYLPNVPETIVAFLASASLGAVWSSCPPEFGTRAVVDRFSQIEPTVLLVADGYRYGTKAIDKTSDLPALINALPTLTATVTVPYLDVDFEYPGAVTWADLLAEHEPPEFAKVPFAHPLYVLYSSGTTGRPKAITHSHGGITVEHLKALALQSDLGAGDRFFWYTTTGWMMWNLLVSGLAVGSDIVLFDGDPMSPGITNLWEMAAETGTTFFGSSAPFFVACRNAGLAPGRDLDLSAVRGVGSTGAPLPSEGFEWVYEAVGSDLLLSSVSGGTDVCSGFVGGNPLLAVRSGEIAAPYLGCAVAAFDPAGRPVIGEQGELVITQPMPSMPVGFWGDDGSRMKAAYFERFPGVWCHGDWITIDPSGSCVISGRSDATLNRGGVRLGTSDFYAVVDSLAEIADSVVIHLERPGDPMGQLVLFVVPTDGAELDDALRARIKSALRTELSPRHVPDRIIAVSAVPRTLTGKRIEIPLKRILSGEKTTDVLSESSIANPASLTDFEHAASELAR